MDQAHTGPAGDIQGAFQVAAVGTPDLQIGPQLIILGRICRLGDARRPGPGRLNAAIQGSGDGDASPLAAQGFQHILHPAQGHIHSF